MGNGRRRSTAELLARERRRNTRLQQENRRLRRENELMRRREDFDAKTGAYSEAAFHRILEARKNAFRRGSIPGFTVAHIDIDDFKSINDGFKTHDAGDAALIYLVQACRSRLSDDALLFRLHGDEFALIIDSADEDAWTVIRARLREPFVTTYADRVIEFTISLDGLVITPPSDLQVLQARLEALLYRAKGDKRGRTTLPAPTEMLLRHLRRNLDVVLADTHSPKVAR